MRAILCLLFFLSGVAALIFESVWFQLAGLVFGSSVWAASVVLASFMGGLALGNAAAAFWKKSDWNPIRIYARLELVIAISGLGLVLAFPHLPSLCSPVFRWLKDDLLLLNATRSLIAFVLLLVPTTAMGATLPVLIEGIAGRKDNFGNALGRLYGWNTLGAVLGVIVCEVILVRHFGLCGAGGLAAGLNVTVAMVGLAIAGKSEGRPSRSSAEPSPDGFGRTTRGGRWLAASFLSGSILLGLEVVWYRFFLLFFDSYSWNFSVMLAVVLTGISLGGLFSAHWLRKHHDAHHFAPVLAVLNALLITVLYRQFDAAYDRSLSAGTELPILLCSLFFMFPICFISGILFALFGNALALSIPSKTKAAGLLTFFNTSGGMCGAILAGTVAIPHLGIERSFFLLALLYGAILILAFPESRQALGRPAARWTLPAVLILALAVFPFGKMQGTFSLRAIRICTEKWNEKRVAFKEGLHETVQYLRSDLLGVPYYYRLVTNNHSMAANDLTGKGYMSLFAYWPLALHPHPRRALLIAFGTGTTAQALTSSKALQTIDMVELSRDIIELSDIIYRPAGANPIRDPRVTVHIEDGRFFLQTTDQTYDIITAEPPPLLHKGVVHLYSQEYFQMVYDRLSPGGIVTYWLPVFQLDASKAKAVVKGFSHVFRHASLWVGADFNWMMVGMKDPLAAVSREQFEKLWNDPEVKAEMAATGLTGPEQLGARFICDGPELAAWTSDTPPLTDNYPQRLSYSFRYRKPAVAADEFRELMAGPRSKRNFLNSEPIRQIWPPVFREGAAPGFLTRQLVFETRNNLNPTVVNLNRFIRIQSLAPCIAWPLGSDEYAWRAILEKFGGDPGRADRLLESFPEHFLRARQTGNHALATELATAARHIAARAVQERKYLLASRFYAEAARQARSEDHRENWTYVRMYLLVQSGNVAEAQAAGREFIDLADQGQALRKGKMETFWKWLQLNASPPSRP